MLTLLLALQLTPAPAQAAVAGSRESAPQVLSPAPFPGGPGGLEAPGGLTGTPVRFGRAPLDPGVPAAPQGSDEGFLSFAAGDWIPPAGERLDPLLAAGAKSEYADGRGSARTFAFAVLAERSDPERWGELEATGATVLGPHPWNAVKLAVPVAALDALAQHPSLRWLGVPRPWQKLHPRLAQRLAQAAVPELLELHVSVFESDLCAASVEEELAAAVETAPGGLLSGGGAQATRARVVHSNGWQDAALRALGAEPLEYAERVRAFRVRVSSDLVAALAASDFVQFVELAGPATLLHDESMPYVGADFVRYYRSGGSSASVVTGQIDSGFDSAHLDLDQTWGVGWELSGTGGAWNDVCGHGSHVAGTTLGDGAFQTELRGGAPGLGGSPSLRFFNIKGGDSCLSLSFSLSTALALLGTPYFDGSMTTPYPHVVNNSWGTIPAGAFFGSEYEPRLIDDAVYSLGQMHVFAAGNDGPSPSTLSSTSSSKNALVVGAVEATSSFPGGILLLSSRGPTGDLRWKPNLTAPGFDVVSTEAGTGWQHTSSTGTSMAAPHVSSAAAQILDGWPALHYKPEATASLLMATALPKDGAVLTSETDPHLDVYGAGRLDSFRANFPTPQDPWTNWSFALPANNYAYGDFTVGPNCTRLVVCMSYSEPAASAGAGLALINDIDLYVDQPPVDPAFNTGEYTEQQSVRDNTELRVILNPAPGTWRWKAWPYFSTTPVYLGVTVSASYGATAPNLQLSTTASPACVKPGDVSTVTVSTTNYDYTSVGTVLSPWLDGGAQVVDSSVDLIDGPVAFYSGPGSVLNLGNIPATGTRVSRYTVWYPLEGFIEFQARVSGENAPLRTQSVWVTVDGTPPDPVDELANSVYTAGVWSPVEGSSDFSWTGGADGLSGLAGYSYVLSEGGPVDPDELVEGIAQGVTLPLGSTSSGHWFNVRAVDLCGNAGPTSSFGPILIDALAPGDPYDFTTLAHQVGVPSCNRRVVGAWSADDLESGIAGYAAVWDESPTTDPGVAVTVTLAELEHEFTVNAPLDAWLHVRAIDLAGNASEVVHYGPFPLEPWDAAVTYCTPSNSSQGCAPTISTSGAPVAAYGPLDDFHVTASGVDGGAKGRLAWGIYKPGSSFGQGSYQKLPASPIWAGGCLLWSGVETLQASGGTLGTCGGSFDTALDWIWFSTHGFPVGTTLYFQYVYRDPMSGANRHTDAVEVTLCQ